MKVAQSENSTDVRATVGEVCDKDPDYCWSVRCNLGRACKFASPSDEKVKQIWDDLGLRTKFAPYMLRFARALFAADKGEASQIDQPFDRVPQHAYDPGFGPVPPIPKVVPLHGRNDACCGKPTECDKNCHLRTAQ